ncbi:conserved hypothetical protein [Talaromyces stipitatus ATCC 10500]|uniref:Major royal jelly protein n=1 Tax=Talaromyces stipitatus (strain ATCC 10500 / CBS 375.48 / QM 6759 / NRRL 1006) TaxID=441959 RepID=B8LXD2_TALSN|nr:uncharacterized protein TSTA_066590 [Talaromyces stipitatus ATCC 10500]EED23213.1 conserved hypothetical protein [Talaromyces stipitatus ATCC 10500]
MFMMILASTLVAASAVFVTAAASQKAPGSYVQRCPNITGTINVSQYQQYPENFDFDQYRCRLYLGSLFNSTVTTYDPYTNEVIHIAKFENITHNHLYHVGGVRVDQNSGQLGITINPANIFETNGADWSGLNWFIKYDPILRKELFRVNLTEVGGGKINGVQDSEVDPRGNYYVIGSFPSSIIRVDTCGNAKLWYLIEPYNATVYGAAGAAAIGDILIVNDDTYNRLLRFNMTEEQGKPTFVDVSHNMTLYHSDAIYLPPKYEGKVLLVAEDTEGLQVFFSKDAQWWSADYLGIIPNSQLVYGNSFTSAATQIGDSVYALESFFFDAAIVPWNAGNRSIFPEPDVTDALAALVAPYL